MKEPGVALFTYPSRYRPLTARGAWRLSIDWLWRRPTFARRIDRFPEGTVYRGWIAWLFVKVMVKR